MIFIEELDNMLRMFMTDLIVFSVDHGTVSSVRICAPDYRLQTKWRKLNVAVPACKDGPVRTRSDSIAYSIT